uniref:Uncharacterized protein n=1 Tax=Rhizophora mucronata TaxID=61149 RepID=A0A2P2NWA6_RHIMU
MRAQHNNSKETRAQERY